MLYASIALLVLAAAAGVTILITWLNLKNAPRAERDADNPEAAVALKAHDESALAKLLHQPAPFH